MVMERSSTPESTRAAGKWLAGKRNGTVPVLCDGDGEALWETGAILRYLAGRYGAAPFWPAEARIG